MHDVSFVLPESYGNWSAHEKYMPAIKMLDEHFCKAYGTVYPIGSEWIEEDPLNKMELTALSGRLSRRAVEPLIKLLHLPKYYSYMFNYDFCDRMFSNKAAADDSKIVFTLGQMYRTVKRCKEKGKKVVVFAANSEPMREHRRIMEEYETFCIKNRYIYGDNRFESLFSKSYELADFIINITDLSRKTYLMAGYPEEKLKFIPMTGSNFSIRKEDFFVGKKKAFISTAFHNFIKGTHRLLLAWEKAKIEEMPLIIVGRICEDVDEFISKYGPFKNVVFLGHQSDLQSLYEEYDAVGVLMSLSEGAVRVTPEMMSFGFPMITSPDACCDIVKNGINGFIIDTKEEDELAERLRWFAEDWERVHAMRKNVLDSIVHKSMTEFSCELGKYLLSLCSED